MDEVDVESDYEWIRDFLNCSEDTPLELELNADGQHFYDNIDRLLTASAPGGLGEFPPAVMPSVFPVLEFQASSTSYTVMLEEAQTAIIFYELRSQNTDRSATTSHNHQPIEFCNRELTSANADALDSVRSTLRSKSRTKITRRLF